MPREFVSTFGTRIRAAALAVAFIAAASGISTRAHADAKDAAASRYLVEWVYRVKWGHDEEFWEIFKRTQIPVLDKERELGYVLDYQVYRPGLHTGEDSRWTYRIVIAYRDIGSSRHGAEVEKQLFPDRAAYKKQEVHRWELIDAHYDLPIKQIDPHAAEE